MQFCYRRPVDINTRMLIDRQLALLIDPESSEMGLFVQVVVEDVHFHVFPVEAEMNKAIMIVEAEG